MEKLIYDTLVTTAQKGSLIKVLGGIFAAGAFTGLVVTKACGNAMVSYKSMWKCHGQKKYSQARRSR
ncbi:hypothetical protein [uncultured Sharpea sp.]|uniref:hypothetical protein n=1 Tax=uncultured Sharpea sp. TaxID=1112738 RepID=UPI0025885893|nr:hypothetical protein [uncultured Sharpea sp.]